MAEILNRPECTYNFLGTHSVTEAFYSYGEAPPGCLCSAYVDLILHEDKWFAVFLVFCRADYGVMAISNLGRPNSRPFDGCPGRSRLICVMCTEEMISNVLLSERLKVINWSATQQPLHGRAFINGERAAIAYSSEQIQNFTRCPYDTWPPSPFGLKSVSVSQELSKISRRKKEFAEHACPLERANVIELNAEIEEEESFIVSLSAEIDVLMEQVASLKAKRSSAQNALKVLKDKRTEDLETIENELNAMLTNEDHQDPKDILRNFLMGAKILHVFVGKNKLLGPVSPTGVQKTISFYGLDVTEESSHTMTWLLNSLKAFFPTRVFTHFITPFCRNLPLLHQLDFGRAVHYWAIMFPILMTFASIQISANTEVKTVIHPLQPPSSRKRKAEDDSPTPPSVVNYVRIGTLRMREQTDVQTVSLFKKRIDVLFRFGAAAPQFNAADELACIQQVRAEAILSSKIKTKSTMDMWMDRNFEVMRKYAIEKYRLEVTKRHFSDLRACPILYLVLQFLGC